MLGDTRKYLEMVIPWPPNQSPGRQEGFLPIGELGDLGSLSNWLVVETCSADARVQELNPVWRCSRAT